MALAMKNEEGKTAEDDELLFTAGSEICAADAIVALGNDLAPGGCNIADDARRQDTSWCTNTADPSGDKSTIDTVGLGCPKEETKEETKIRHIMANRKSAKESRERRKEKLAKLSSAMETLTADNLVLRKVNSELTDGIHDMKQQLKSVTMVLLQERQDGVMARENVNARIFGIPSTEHYDSALKSEAEKTKNNVLPDDSEIFMQDDMVDLTTLSAPSCNVSTAHDTISTTPTPTKINDDAQHPPKKLTEEEKRMRRILANRKSAKESRIRRREEIAKLSARIDMLTADNRALCKINAMLKEGVRDMREQLRLTLAVAQQRQRRMTREVLNVGFVDPTPDVRMARRHSPLYQQQQPYFSHMKAALLRDAVNQDFDSALRGSFIMDME